MEIKDFTPETLRIIREKNHNTLNLDLIENIKQKILKANLQNKLSIEFPLRVDSPWKKLFNILEI